MALFAIVVLLVALCLAGCSQPGGASSSTIEKKTYPLVLQTDAKKSVEESEMNLYFLNGGDVPYVAVSEFLPLFGRLYEDENSTSRQSRLNSRAKATTTGPKEPTTNGR